MIIFVNKHTIILGPSIALLLSCFLETWSKSRLWVIGNQLSVVRDQGSVIRTS